MDGGGRATLGAVAEEPIAAKNKPSNGTINIEEWT
jgi:hypothetical protein